MRLFKVLGPATKTYTSISEKRSLVEVKSFPHSQLFVVKWMYFFKITIRIYSRSCSVMFPFLAKIEMFCVRNLFFRFVQQQLNRYG